MENWSYSKEFDSVYNMRTVRSISCDGAVIAHVNCAFGDGEQRAKQIAAVPDLIEIVTGYREMVQRVIDNWSSGDLAGAVNALEAFRDNDAEAVLSKAGVA